MRETVKYYHKINGNIHELVYLYTQDDHEFFFDITANDIVRFKVDSIAIYRSVLGLLSVELAMITPDLESHKQIKHELVEAFTFIKESAKKYSESVTLEELLTDLEDYL